MGLPAALILPVSSVRAAIPRGNCENVAVLADATSDNASPVQMKHQLDLAPRVSRFFNAYLDANLSRRAEFRKAVAYVSGRVEVPALPNSGLQEDIAAALSIAQDAADLAHAIDAGETIDHFRSGSVDFSLLADASATLALAYRYVVGLYATDPMLSELGDVAVRFVLLAETESGSGSASMENNVDPPRPPAISRDAFRPAQAITSTVSLFVPLGVPQNDAVSLEAISQRLKDQILLSPDWFDAAIETTFDDHRFFDDQYG